MIKTIFKKIFLPTLYLILRYKEEPGLKVLAYHRITEAQDLGDPLKVSKVNFDKQMHFLKKHYNLISGEQLVDIIKGEKELPAKACLVTFDDGWEDNYSQAFPVLNKHGVPAIIFISTDFIGSNKVFWHERLQNILRNIPSDVPIAQLQSELEAWPVQITENIIEIIRLPFNQRPNLINQLIQDLKKLDVQKLSEINDILLGYSDIKDTEKTKMLSWAQVKEMSESNIHFGSHTENHTILTHVDNDKISYELTSSKRTIEENLGRKVYFFSYPNGDYNMQMEKLVKDAGYLAAFAMVTGKKFFPDSLFEIKRYMMREDTCIGIGGKFSELLFKVELAGFRSFLKSKINSS